MLACGNKCCAYCKESNNNCKNLCFQADICEDMKDGNCNIRQENNK